MFLCYQVPKEWKNFLSVGKNKETLLSFLSSEWSHDPKHLPENVTLFVGEGTSCISIVKQHQTPIVAQVPILCCDHEEADTRLALHAKQASDEGFTSVVIRTPDTDVIAILACLQQQIVCELYIETGTGDRKQLIDINKVSASLPFESEKSLIGFHAFTGNYFKLSRIPFFSFSNLYSY